MRDEHQVARRLALTVRYADHTSTHCPRTLPEATDHTVQLATAPTTCTTPSPSSGGGLAGPGLRPRTPRRRPRPGRRGPSPTHLRPRRPQDPPT
ncbi:DinB/UmuC family translesion DNA polymerase [Streptomyces mutabilis]|uniref:DinB/UmuC family translesion DNA polymerase n=1 Tax=Streptomyces mutabilis TaxID=67332 RepID=UPI0038B5CC32